ncbi:Fic family protein [bacterium]|nr:Fic family protein [bacterium]
MKYNWQYPDWPSFSYHLSAVEDKIYVFAEQLGKSSGALKAMDLEDQTEAIIHTMVSEAIKTSEIEGEYLSRKDVMSSIRNKMGLNQIPEEVNDLNARGIAELMLEVRQTFAEALSEEMLFNWHRLLLPDSPGMKIGVWRSHLEPMQVVSGAIGKEKVHFEAPPSNKVPEEIQVFIQWFNDTAPGGPKEIKYAPVRASICHLYFESIHPFEDGNGRIGRALAEKCLSQTSGQPVLLSLSATIESNKKAYYKELQMGQRSNEITSWLIYFTNTIIDAQLRAEGLINFTLAKAKFFDRYQDDLNLRQLKVINRMLEEGPEGFEGGMNARKYIGIAKTSKATATRDLQDLVEIGAFVPVGKGRSTRYELKFADYSKA